MSLRGGTGTVCPGKSNFLSSQASPLGWDLQRGHCFHLDSGGTLGTLRLKDAETAARAAISVNPQNQVKCPSFRGGCVDGTQRSQPISAAPPTFTCLPRSLSHLTYTVPMSLFSLHLRVSLWLHSPLLAPPFPC